MIKQITMAIFCGLIYVVNVAGISGINSSGAPIGSTGAPGDMTCGKAGCHTGESGANNINTGTGLMGIILNNNLEHYSPGEEYSITVEIQQKDIVRFGYSLTVLNEKNERSGTLEVIEPGRTQIIQGILDFAGREYATYTYEGTQPAQNETGRWSLKWKAPNTNEGKITLYAATVAADNDGTDKGDWVYTASLELKEQPLANSALQTPSFYVYPSIVEEAIFISIDGLNPATTEIRLVSLDGKIRKKITGEMAGAHLLRIAKPDVAKGLYLLQISGMGQSHVSKVFIQ